MSDIVDRLEAHEMVRREPDRSDHRVRRVVATAVGRDTVQRLLAARPQLSRPPLERLRLDVLRALTQGIAAWLEVARELGEGPSEQTN